jgi:hypothetical protein
LVRQQMHSSRSERANAQTGNSKVLVNFSQQPLMALPASAVMSVA